MTAVLWAGAWAAGLLIAQAEGLTMRQAVIAVMLALIGGPVTAWITTKGAAKKAGHAADVAEQVAESVGEKNGHGTVQDQGAATLNRLAAMQTTLESLVDSAGHVNARLKAHDRELAETRRKLEGR